MRTTVWRPDTPSDTATQALTGVLFVLKCHVAVFKQSIKAAIHLQHHLAAAAAAAATCGPGAASLALETDDK